MLVLGQYKQGTSRPKSVSVSTGSIGQPVTVSGGSTVVDHSAHHHKVEDSSRAMSG